MTLLKKKMWSRPLPRTFKREITGLGKDVLRAKARRAFGREVFEGKALGKAKDLGMGKAEISLPEAYALLETIVKYVVI